jgi:hypothetical protein
MIYKSTDYGVSWSFVFSTMPDWISSFYNIFNQAGNFYYIKAPGWGILKSSDLVHFDEYWLNKNLRELFIDHNGVLLATYWTWQPPYERKVYYRKNSEK